MLKGTLHGLKEHYFVIGYCNGAAPFPPRIEHGGLPGAVTGCGKEHVFATITHGTAILECKDYRAFAIHMMTVFSRIKPGLLKNLLHTQYPLKAAFCFAADSVLFQNGAFPGRKFSPCLAMLRPVFDWRCLLRFHGLFPGAKNRQGNFIPLVGFLLQKGVP